MTGSYISAFILILVFSSVFRSLIVSKFYLSHKTHLENQFSAAKRSPRFTTIMIFSTTSSQRATQKVRQVASKILQKMRLSKGKGDTDLEEISTAEVQVARFVTFERPSEAPQIIDLKAMRRSLPPQPSLIHAYRSSPSRSQADINQPELRLRSDRSAAASLDDIADYEGYEWLDDDDSDLDWTLLDLPEKVYQRLANESRHSLI